MKITNVRIHLIKGEDSNLKGYAEVTLDEAFAVKNIRICENEEKELYLKMPSRPTPNGKPKDVAHPINKETRDMFEKEIFEAYHTALEQEE